MIYQPVQMGAQTLARLALSHRAATGAGSTTYILRAEPQLDPATESDLTMVLCLRWASRSGDGRSLVSTPEAAKCTTRWSTPGAKEPADR
jgi:hypothetical protein